MKKLLVASLFAFTFLHCLVAGVPSIKPPSGPIVGGLSAKQNQFPYQVLLKIENIARTIYCGGTLIAEDWILTSGQCLQSIMNITVILGTIYSNGDHGEIQVTKNYFIHDNYTYPLNNIGLVKLESPVEESDSIKYADLPESGSASSSEQQGYDEHIAITSGWGRLETDSCTDPLILQYINVFVVPNYECENIYGDIVKDSMICMSTAPDCTTTCNGDPGAPLILSHTNILVGISSFVLEDGCENGSPSIFTRVSSHLDWIDNVLDLSS